MTRPSRSRRLRKRLNRRLYAGLYRAYRTIFATPAWTGRVAPESIRRVLVVQHYGVGDMILTTPLLAFLKERLPAAEIDVLASPRNAAVLAGNAHVTNVFVHDHTWRRWLRVLPRLRARRYDVILLGQGGKGLAEGVTASLIAHRSTYKVSVWRPKRYRGLFTTATRVRPGAMHTAEQVLHLGLHALGEAAQPSSLAGRRYPLRMAEDPRADARIAAFLAERNLQRFAVVNLSAHFASRDWAPEHCAVVVGRLLERHPDLAVVLTPAPGKQDAVDQVSHRCVSPRVIVAPVFPLLELAALVRRAELVLSTNTALVHLASACRRPVVALYAPEVRSDVTLWLPIGVPCRALASPYRGMVRDIPPEVIAEAFDDLRREASTRGEATAAQLVP